MIKKLYWVFVNYFDTMRRGAWDYSSKQTKFLVEQPWIAFHSDCWKNVHIYKLPTSINRYIWRHFYPLEQRCPTRAPRASCGPKQALVRPNEKNECIFLFNFNGKFSIPRNIIVKFYSRYRIRIRLFIWLL